MLISLPATARPHADALTLGQWAPWVPITGVGAVLYQLTPLSER